MTRLASALLALLVAAPAHPQRGGLFSAQAVSIGASIRWAGPPDRLMAGSLTVPSPDGRSTLAIAYRERGDELKHSFDSSHSVRLSGRAGSNRFRERYQAIGDVLWSPDSRHVAVSLSGGGVGGVYDLYVLGTGRTAHPISLPFRRLLNPPRNCDLGRFSNVAAVKWLAGERLLVMARQLWEDSCPQKDRAVFYDYDLTTRKVRRSYRLAEAKRIFGAALGSLAR